MKFINELMAGWEFADLEAELDRIEESYKKLVGFTTLFEGVLDNLPDSVIEKVAEIEQRLEAVARARVLLTKLKTMGAYSPEQVKKMRDRVSKNAAKLKKLLVQTQSEIQAIGNKVNAEVSKVEDDDRENATGSFDLRDLSRTSLSVLYKINAGRLNPDADDDATLDAIDDLMQYGLIDKSEKITAKGKQAILDFKKTLSAKPSKDDLAKKDWQNRDELADL